MSVEDAWGENDIIFNNITNNYNNSSINNKQDYAEQKYDNQNHVTEEENYNTNDQIRNRAILHDKIDQVTNDAEIVDKSTKVGDLFLLGKLWINLLEIGLLGTKWTVPSMLPKVDAAAPLPPQKPPKMRYKDLPLYTTPHLDYKEHEADKIKKSCPDVKNKLVHKALYPHVTAYRKHFSGLYKDFCDESNEMKKQAVTAVTAKKDEFLTYMRCGKNKTQRQSVVILAAASGLFLSRKYNTFIPKMLYTTAGTLAGGALCFPKETDEVIRSVAHKTGKVLVSIYNMYCHKEYVMRERIPCKEDMPGPLSQRVPNKCPDKKR